MAFNQVWKPKFPLNEDWFPGHWWQPDPSGSAMVHRASGEAIIYRGPIDGSLSHQFEYRYRDLSYPLIVDMKNISYPHSTSTRHAGYPLSLPFPRLMRAHVWVIDHERSAQLSRRGGGYPPYALWHLADVAMREAAMLWDDSVVCVHRADEVGARGGYLNATWRTDLFRRFAWDERVEDIRWNILKSETAYQLPLAAFGKLTIDLAAPNWECTPDVSFDMYGKRLSGGTIGMRNRSDGMLLGTIKADAYIGGQPRLRRSLVCWASYWISEMPLSFWRYRVSDSSLDRRRTEAETLWAAEIWSTRADSDLRELPPRGAGEAATSITQNDPTWRKLKEQDEGILQLRYKNLLLQLNAYEHALPVCPPLDETDTCIDNFVPPPTRQIDIKSFPVGGKRLCDAAIRTSIEPTPDAPIENWVLTFDGLQ